MTPAPIHSRRKRLSGAGKTDVLDAGPGGDGLYGDAGDHVLVARIGSDRLRGGSGADTRDGGPGADSASDDPNDPSQDVEIILT